MVRAIGRPIDRPAAREGMTWSVSPLLQEMLGLAASPVRTVAQAVDRHTSTCSA